MMNYLQQIGYAAAGGHKDKICVLPLCHPDFVFEIKGKASCGPGNG